MRKNLLTRILTKTLLMTMLLVLTVSMSSCQYLGKIGEIGKDVLDFVDGYIPIPGWDSSDGDPDDPNSGGDSDTPGGDTNPDDSNGGDSGDNKPECKHEFDDGVVIKESTCYEQGVKVYTCKICSFKNEELLDLIPTAYILKLEGIGELRVAEDGKYSIDDPVKVGYKFIKWVDSEGADFASEGVINKDVTVTPVFELLITSTVEELEERAAGGAEEIRIANDIVIDRTIYVTGQTRLTSQGAVKLTRASNFAGDMFVIGQNASGGNNILENGPAELIFGAKDGTSEITIDGNKDNVEVDVVGSALFLVNSARVSMYDGAILSNHMKVGNERSASWADRIGTTSCTMGGSAVFVVHGVFDMYGGVVENNSVNVENIGSEEENTNNISSYGGAIFNVGTFNMYGGVIKNNAASRGGAIYTRGRAYLFAGTVENNVANNKGGAICASENPHSEVFIGAENATAGSIVFRNNVAKIQGGVYLGYFQSPFVVLGGARFENNRAESKVGGVVTTSGPVVINNSEFIGNYAYEGGGVIYQYYEGEDTIAHEVLIRNSHFEGNEAGRGGAVLISAQADGLTSASYLNISNCTFKANTAVQRVSEKVDSETGETKTVYSYGSGGVIYVTKKTKVDISGSDFENNTAEVDAGVIYLSTDVEVNIKGEENTFVSNAAKHFGGVVYATGAKKLTVSGAIFRDNGSYGGFATERGGAIYNVNIPIQTKNCVFEGNTATVKGGAVYITGDGSYVDGDNNADTNTVYSKFINNKSDIGGAVCVYGVGEFYGADFSENISSSDGGAIYAGTAARITVDKCLFENNAVEVPETATADEKFGGAIAVISSEYLNITSSKFVGNKLVVPSGVAGVLTYGGAVSATGSVKLTVKNSEFAENYAQYGGAASTYAVAEITGTSFKANVAEKRGGALYVGEKTLNVINAVFTENKAATEHGGAISCLNAVATIENSTFDKNEANKNGGALYVNTPSETVTVYTKSCNFTSNKSVSGNGGAVYITGTGVYQDGEKGATDKGSVFGTKAEDGNYAATGGGAIFVYGSAELYGSKISYNKAFRAGAVYVASYEKSPGSLLMDNAEIVGNEASVTVEGQDNNGGALYVSGGSVIATNTLFNSNYAAALGGAIYATQIPAENPIVTKNCIFKNNSSVNGGGAIRLTGTALYRDGDENGNNGSTFEGNSSVSGGAILTYADIELYGTSFLSNSATTNGGAVCVAGKNTVIKNSVISGNTAGNDGGAIYVSVANLEIENSELKLNRADRNGGAIYLTQNTKDLVTPNCVVSENSAGVNGGGMYMTGTAKYQVSGKVVIIGNTANSLENDLYIASGNDIKIVGILEAGTVLGITRADGGDAEPEFELIQYPLATMDYTMITTGAASYQWYVLKNGEWVAMEGGTSSKLTGATVGLTYKCIATCGDATIESNEMVYSDTIVTKSHPICGEVCSHDGAHENLVWYPIFSGGELIAVSRLGGNYYLARDIELSSTVNVNLDLNLCLNGNDIRYVGTETASMIVVASDATLTVTDCGTYERVGYIDPTTNKWVEGSYSGEGTAYAVTLTGGMIADGNASSGTIRVNGKLNMLGGNMVNNTATYGGAISISDGATVDIKGVSFVANVATTQGGAMIIAAADPSIENCRFIANRAITSSNSNGGALYVNKGSAKVINCLFDSNYAQYRGGAIYATQTISGNPIVTKNCTFKNNKAENEGGAIRLTGTALYHDGDENGNNGSSFIGNESVNGGAIMTYANITLNGSSFSENKATKSGAAIYVAGLTTNINDATFTDNAATTSGGAIYVTSSDVTVKDSTFTGNESTKGGAIYVTSNNSLATPGCVIKENSASENGGGIYMTGTAKYQVSGTVVIMDNTVNSLENDLFIAGENDIEINGILESGAVIGITREGDDTDPEFEVLQYPLTMNDYTVFATGKVSYQWYVLNEGAWMLMDGATSAKLSGALEGNTYKCVITSGESTIEMDEFVYTTEIITQTHPICGSVCSHSGAHEDIIWNPIYSAGELIVASKFGGNYYLARDIELSETFNVNVDLNLCLNGNDIRYVGTETASMIVVASDVTLTVTDCGTSERVGYIDPVTNKWLEGAYSGEGTAYAVTLTGGMIADGNASTYGTIQVLGTLNMYGGNMVNNTAGHGGAIRFSEGAAASINGVSFVANTAKTQGGAVRIDTSVIPDITNCRFIGNRADAASTSNQGGAIYINGGSAIITDCLFDSNYAYESGGVMYATKTPAENPIVTRNCIFKNNTAGTAGGAIRLTGTALYRDGDENGSNGSTFIGNESVNGGAIMTYANITLNGSSFSENKATNSGAAIYVAGLTTNINDAMFTQNSAVTSGGAIYVTNGTLNVLGGEMSENKVTAVGTSTITYMGGAIAVSKTSNVTVDGVTFKSNNGSTSGGAIGIYGSSSTTETVEIKNCYFENNSAYNGGAVYAGAAAVVTVSNITAKGNAASSNGAVIYLTSANSTLSLNGAVVYDNNTAKNITSNGFVHIANVSNILDIYKDSVTLVSSSDGSEITITDALWNILLQNPNNATVNYKSESVTEG